MPNKFSRKRLPNLKFYKKWNILLEQKLQKCHHHFEFVSITYLDSILPTFERKYKLSFMARIMTHKILMDTKNKAITAALCE